MNYRMGQNSLVLPSLGLTNKSVLSKHVQYSGNLTLVAQMPKHPEMKSGGYKVGDFLLVKESGGTFWASMSEPKKYAAARFHIFHVEAISPNFGIEVVVHEEGMTKDLLVGKGRKGLEMAALTTARYAEGLEMCGEVKRDQTMRTEQIAEERKDAERRMLRFDFVTESRAEVLRTGTDVRLRYFDHEYILRGQPDGWVEIEHVGNLPIWVTPRRDLRVAFKVEEV